MDLALNTQNQLARVSYTTFQNWPTNGSFVMSTFVAGTYLATNLESANWQVVDEQSFACWYPVVENHELRAAYWLQIAGALPHQRHAGIVDASTGEVLLEWSGISEEVLNLTVELPYWQPYDHSETQISPCKYQNVEVNGSNRVANSNGVVSVEAGTHADVLAMLSGSYVETSNDDDGETAVHGAAFDAPFVNEVLSWTDEQATRPELNLYYHTTFIHDWYKVVDPPYNALDYPMPAVANYGGSYDNAFWNGWGTYYGAGMNYGNFAMYSDVIYHEYTHGVTDGIYPNDMLPYTDQPGAMNEGWSDYFACTINGDPLMAEWLTGNAHSFFRNLESHMVFPRNWVGEVHGDSPFISAPLWTIRQELGATYADSLAHFARYGLSELFFDYFVDVLEADDNDGNLENGTPNATVIYDAFGDHGIGPGARPNYVIRDMLISDANGNNNGMAEAGETATVTFSIVNDVTLFPPAATNVTLTVSTDDNTLTLNNAVHSLGTIGPRDTVAIGPINIQVSASAIDHWGVVTLTFTADQFEEPVVFPLEFTVGIPKLHIVTRSLETDVDKYVTGTLREMDKIYQHKRLTPTEELNISSLPDNGVVLWLSGDGDGSGLLPGDTTTLSDHLYHGGYVFMSGKNILGGIEGTHFARWTLGVDFAGRSRIRMATSIMSPFVEGETFLLTGSGGAANQDSMTILQLTSSTLPILEYGNAGNNYAGAMGPVSGHSIVFGFGIEAVADNSPIGNQSRAYFLDRILAWAGFPSAADEIVAPTSQPNDFTLHTAYPNPFNSSVKLNYNIGNSQDTRLLIYDVLGREVLSTPLSNQSTSYNWQPSMASGVYFAILKSSTQVTAPQKLLLLR
ncbi:MAG: T9SS type A sorting domain-containing protein [bacterium]|nr:T9SS type A sorting domain-containing protein [bacterium]